MTTTPCTGCAVQQGTHQPSEALHQIAEPKTQQPEALRLAQHLEQFRSFPDDLAAAKEIRRQHARIVELEAQLAAAQQAVQAVVPSDADIDAAIQAFDWDGWIDQGKAKRAFTREALARWAAPAHPAEGVPVQAVLDGGTPGPWRVRKRTNDAGEVLDCFVTAPDCQGRAYDAHILGDDYDSIELKLADAELIVAAVNAYRALAATHPTQQGMDAQDAIRALIAQHGKELEKNEYAYFELAYTRSTGWMAWITDKPLCSPVVNPDRKVLASGQGDTPEAACAAALAAQAKQGGA